MPVTASGSAILKVLGVPPMPFRASKLNACFTARVYDAMPSILTAKTVSYTTDGWGLAKRRFCIRTSEKNVHRSRIKKEVTPGGYCKAWHKRQWLEAMQASMGSTERRQGSTALKIRNIGPDRHLRNPDGR